eukprot:TRINITY_DN26968_c0_g1_i2.p1 TRINITY_DN26968_c0_g1~~TRINITY_DN26968_c0_g1_i2.p1  ORF type:complete len:608 (+),score=85.21 TRINITY_DN26968_c0_g1_i2:73-1896(+)
MLNIFMSLFVVFVFAISASADDFVADYEAPEGGITKWDAEALSDNGPRGTYFRRVSEVSADIWQHVFKFHDPFKEKDVDAIFHAVLSDASRISRARAALRVMFTALPKSHDGRLTPQLARYALHRHFLQEKGMFLRGIQPSDRQMAHVHNSTREWIPGYIEGLFSQRAKAVDVVLDLDDLAAFVAVFERLIEKETEQNIEMLLKLLKLPKQGLVKDVDARCVFVAHVQFLSALDITDSDKNATALAFSKLAKGACSVTSEELQYGFIRSKSLRDFMVPVISRNVLPSQNFEQLVQSAISIETEMQKYTDEQCSSLRTFFKTLEKPDEPGYVPLDKYYESKSFSHWLFVESTDFLRYAGSYDDTSTSPRIVEANYLESRMNCVDSSTVYAVCCKSECTSLLQELELGMQSSVGTPQDLAEIVSRTGFARASGSQHLSDESLGSLKRVAQSWNGVVPLHSRGFEMWMHHLFPRQCPKPSMTRTSNMLTASEWMGEEDDIDVSTYSAMFKPTTADEMAYLKLFGCIVVAALGLYIKKSSRRGAPNAPVGLGFRVGYFLTFVGVLGVASSCGMVVKVVIVVAFAVQMILLWVGRRAVVNTPSSSVALSKSM